MCKRDHHFSSFASRYLNYWDNNRFWKRVVCWLDNAVHVVDCLVVILLICKQPIFVILRTLLEIFWTYFIQINIYWLIINIISHKTQNRFGLLTWITSPCLMPYIQLTIWLTNSILKGNTFRMKHQLKKKLFSVINFVSRRPWHAPLAYP